MPYAEGCKGCGTACDGVRCDGCNAKRREEEAQKRAHRRERGLCLTCGAPVAKTKVAGGAAAKRVREPAAYCARHLAYYAARQRAG